MEAPEFFPAAGFRTAQFNHQEKRQIHYSSSFPADTKPNNAAVVGGDHFAVEDLLDFSNEDAVLSDGALETITGGNSTDSSTATVVDSCNSSFVPAACHPGAGYATDVVVGPRNFADNGNFSGDLGVPYEDLAELEWLSNFVEESFSSEDLQKLQLISGQQARPDETSETLEFQPEIGRNNPIFNPDVAVPGKARSKRSRAAPCNWTSRLLVLSPTTSSSESDGTIVPPPAVAVAKKTVKAVPKKKESSHQDGGGGNGDGRKCLHCATDKTPQWRSGPLGPKTLCNACGVRYKSGRLVPEYRPAASPTFVLTKHSNSHRKVMELRRQKEMQMAQQQQQQFLHHHHQNMMFDVTNGEDYLIHQHVGPDFRQLI